MDFEYSVSLFKIKKRAADVLHMCCHGLMLGWYLRWVVVWGGAGESQLLKKRTKS
jgi:hypothetical protein